MTLKALIAMALLAGTAISAEAADAPAAAPAQEAPKPAPDYHCPPTAYINCMPPITEDRREACAKDYVAWVQTHCPNTQVVY